MAVGSLSTGTEKGDPISMDPGSSSGDGCPAPGGVAEPAAGRVETSSAEVESDDRLVASPERFVLRRADLRGFDGVELDLEVLS